MGGITGWINYRADHGGNDELIRRMGESLTSFDHGDLHVTLGKCGALCAAGLKGSQADCCQRDGVLAVIQGIYHWRNPDLAKLAEREGSASALIDGYLSKGADVLNNLHGRFSIALIRENRDEVFLATDRVASEPLLFAVSGRTILFASTPDALKYHPSANCDIDPQAIFNYLYFHVVPGPKSIYKGLHKLLPGNCVQFKQGSEKITTYWNIDYQESYGGRSFRELKEEFLSILRSSIKETASGEKTGAFLSGGTDSSTVTGLLSETLETPVPTYSIGFDAEGYDEIEYARIASRRFKTDHHEYYVTPEDIVEAVPRIAEIYGEPFGNSSAVPTYYCAKLAGSDGITRMLGGDGGDELFAGNPHYARQYLFSIYDAIPEIISKQLIEPFVMSSVYPNVTLPLRKLRSYVQQASIPMPARLETYNLLTRLGVGQVIDPEFLDQVDPSNPEYLMVDQYRNSNARTMLNKMLWLDYKFVLTDNDLPKVSRMCELAGLEVAYPLLSDELVAFAARLPPKLKLKRNRLRYFFKEALQEFLPTEIINKRKQGFGLPVGNWISVHAGFRQIAKDNLSDLKSRKIIRAGLVDKLLDTHLDEHAPYYGTMIWVLMMLEQWFKIHHAKV